MSRLRYVYAVCRPFGTPLQVQLSGVDGVPPRLLAHHGLIAVVSSVPEADFAEDALRVRFEDLDWLSATTRAHQGVIGALTTVTTPLPMPLATVFRDDSGVRAMIEAREDGFRRTLDRLAGRVEWGVKAYGGSSREATEKAAVRLHELLARHAEDTRLHAPQNAALSGAAGPNVLNAAYLVPRAASEGFVELVDRAREDTPGLRIELTGPWAAYSFTGEER
ncbi:GvpL/GvpF family gas vesicle protein [Streptomyces mangrovisoli]|uniref:Gas vesicle protein n=1 Tax=Streptomyces mangrovisoli TaxID=1428628 RepID=A0A1J4P310_9ACTN|nr:GvpL/GvpF family gas vesicle protein [Streptomyces mangrovisoli]OIJ67869.1 gas vesicle protein [Streptomyces mangrovisoli]